MNMNQNIIYNNLNVDCQKIIQDKRIKIKLKEHQKTAIHAMLAFEETGKVSFIKKAYIKNYQIYDQNEYNKYYYWRAHNDEEEQKKYKDMCFEIETNYGILADKVGSGKTFMAMGLITYKQTPTERDRIISSSVYTVTKYKDTETPLKTNLILVPHNLINQWKIAFGYCTLKTFTISKKADIEYLQWEENIFQDEPTCPDADFDETNCINYYDTIIISATMFDTFYDKFKTTKWSRIIIDEVVSIKLPADIEFKCNFIWFLTATPSGIRCVRKNYIRSLVNTMSDYTINNIIIKNNDDYVDQSMNLPNLNQIIIKCLTPKELQIIKEYVDNDVLNMLNGGDIQGAISRLNCNVETSENILEVVTKKIKKELHNKRHELEYEQKRIPDDKKTHDEKIKKINDKIKELEAKCAGIEHRIISFKEENCPICYGEFESPILTPCCNNLFCVQCLTMCKTCPMCREIINLKTCTVINDKIKSEEIKKDTLNKKEHKLCSKVDNLITLIKRKPHGKFLVFSNYDRTFENLYQKLLENNIIHSRLVGSNVVINSIIRRFESGEIKVLMLNALNYGSGLNLQMASDIIIYHELDIELETQVIGRAQRLGRTEPLNVYYLLNENEKVNCRNPTLNLDIFADDTTMLEKFILGNKESDDVINLDKEINTEDSMEMQELILAKTAKSKKKTTDTKKKTTVTKNNTITKNNTVITKQQNKQTNNNMIKQDIIQISDSESDSEIEIANAIKAIEDIYVNNQHNKTIKLRPIPDITNLINNIELSTQKIEIPSNTTKRSLVHSSVLAETNVNIELSAQIIEITSKKSNNPSSVLADNSNKKIVKKTIIKKNKTADKQEQKIKSTSVNSNDV